MSEIKYNAAFQCGNCPKSNDPEAERSCPAWWDWVEKRKDGNVEVMQPNGGCGLQMGAKWMTDMMANNEFATVNAIAVRETVVQQISLLMSISSAAEERMKELKEVQVHVADAIRELRDYRRAIDVQSIDSPPEKPAVGIFGRLLGWGN